MFAHAGVIYLEHKLGSLTTKQMLHKMQQKDIHFSDWLPLLIHHLSGMKYIYFSKNVRWHRVHL